MHLNDTQCIQSSYGSPSALHINLNRDVERKNLSLHNEHLKKFNSEKSKNLHKLWPTFYIIQPDMLHEAKIKSLTYFNQENSNFSKNMTNL